MRVEGMDREQQCVSETQRERATQSYTDGENSAIIIKVLNFVESLPCVGFLWSQCSVGLIGVYKI